MVVMAWDGLGFMNVTCGSCLVQYLGDLGCEHIVIYNDELTVDEIEGKDPKGILVSPGPGTVTRFTADGLSNYGGSGTEG